MNGDGIAGRMVAAIQAEQHDAFTTLDELVAAGFPLGQSRWWIVRPLCEWIPGEVGRRQPCLAAHLTRSDIAFVRRSRKVVPGVVRWTLTSPTERPHLGAVSPRLIADRGEVR